MIQIKWTHLAIGLALVVGILIGSHFQFSPGLAQAQSSTDPTLPVAMTVYNNTIYIVRGNDLYIFKTEDNRFLKNRKNIIFAGKTEIDKGLGADTTVGVYYNYNARPQLPLPAPNRK